MIDATKARKLHYEQFDSNKAAYWNMVQNTIENAINGRIKNLSRYTIIDVEDGFSTYVCDQLKKLKYVVIQQTANNVAEYTGKMTLRIEW